MGFLSRVGEIELVSSSTGHSLRTCCSSKYVPHHIRKPTVDDVSHMLRSPQTIRGTHHGLEFTQKVVILFRLRHAVRGDDDIEVSQAVLDLLPNVESLLLVGFEYIYTLVSVQPID